MPRDRAALAAFPIATTGRYTSALTEGRLNVLAADADAARGSRRGAIWEHYFEEGMSKREDAGDLLTLWVRATAAALALGTVAIELRPR